MKVQKAIFVSSLGFDKSIVKLNDKYYSFEITPFRNLTEKDLTLIPYFQETKTQEEMPDYLLRFYGLELA